MRKLTLDTFTADELKQYIADNRQQHDKQLVNFLNAHRDPDLTHESCLDTIAMLEQEYIRLQVALRRKEGNTNE